MKTRNYFKIGQKRFVTIGLYRKKTLRTSYCNEFWFVSLLNNLVIFSQKMFSGDSKLLNFLWEIFRIQSTWYEQIILKFDTFQ